MEGNSLEAHVNGSQGHGARGFIPQYLLDEIARRGGPELRLRALRSIDFSSRVHMKRLAAGHVKAMQALASCQKRRSIYDASGLEGDEGLPGKKARGEGKPPAGDREIDEAYDGIGQTFDFYQAAFGRRSIDDRCLQLVGSVHYGPAQDNAYWNGKQMIFGDGDGVIFDRFTRTVDIAGHELSHGVDQYEANLEYEGQPGALNESFADVFGIMVKQHGLKVTAGKADWLIGKGIFMPGIKGKALRSMKDPGTAYNDKRLGKDPQPAHMDGYVTTQEDNGGVHINSGIPNRAFCLTATRIGGYAWEKAGKIWYLALTDLLPKDAGFQQAADTTFAAAGRLFGAGSSEQEAVAYGWSTVGITVAPVKERVPAIAIKRAK